MTIIGESLIGKPAAFVAQGNLGWGNRKTGLEAYGEGGRWGENREGDLLGDALERLGATEGAGLVVIVLPRFSVLNAAEVEDEVCGLVEQMVAAKL